MTCRSNGHPVTVDHDRQWEKVYTFSGSYSRYHYANQGSLNFYSSYNLNHCNFPGCTTDTDQHCSSIL